MSAQRSQDEDDPDEISAGPSRKRHKSAHVYSNNISSSLQLSQQEQSASSGILEYVTVKNFMCLDNMMCAFSPQINLVQEPQALYKFFLKATQLQQMNDDYNELEKALKVSLDIIEDRKEIIQIEKAEEDAKKQVEGHEKNVAKIQEKVAHFQEKYEEQQQIHKGHHEQLTTVTNQLVTHSHKLKECNESLIKTRKLHKDKQMLAVTADRKVKGIMKEIYVLKEAIKKDNDDTQTQWASHRALWQEKMDGIQNEMKELEQNMRTEETHHVNLMNTVGVKKAELTQFVMEEKAIRRHAIEQELQGLKGQQSNQFTVYGQWVPQLLHEINIAHKKRAFKKKPVLRQLMKKINFGQQPQPIVIVSRFREQVHDVSKYEVQSDKYPSLWSMLMISSDVVANTLIDQCQVESTLLIPTAQEAGQILKNKTTVPRNCKVAYTLNRDIYYPDPNYRLYSGRGQQPARFLQVSLEEKVRALVANLENSKEEMRTHNLEMQKSRANLHKLEEEVQASSRKLTCSKKKMDQLRLQLADLQNQEEQPPPDVSQLEDDIKQQEVALIEAQASLEKLKEGVTSSKDSFMQISSAYEELKKGEKKLFQEAENMKEKLSEDEDILNKLSHTVELYKEKERDFQKNKKESELNLEKTREKLREELQKAGKFQPRKDTVRSVHEVKRQYDGLQDRLNREMAANGDPLTVANRYKEIKQRFITVSGEIESHCNLIKKIKESLSLRLEHYKRFRRLLAIMIKSNFKISLSIRNLHGSLNFDHDNSRLTLSVVKMGSETDAEAINILMKESQNKKQTLAMMSGGERSFATVSFIIALWDVIESPIRILDEFDVFMDIVARRQSLTMMVKAANTKTQYIYLTPIELDTTGLPNINVIKMPDPQRAMQ
ncbi:structural maintenance of chromosomes protein 6-like [Homarus americanus]|uniref:Structural maintenance of chromosomes protein 6-like n=1 Tax=Homarus americanus TaxID=6706 RepID=A0A8J5MLM6_HOMAM|nr:structural maintenance of chromosomes protein 6-like [Homarus americanus]